MKVLYICADAGIPLDGTKGASVHVRQTIVALQSRGVDVTVLALRPGAPGTVPCRVLPAATLLGRLQTRSGGRVAAQAAALASARNLDAQVPFSPGEVGVIYERYSLWSLAGAVLADRLAAPLVLEVNAPLVEEQSRYRQIDSVGVAVEIERFLARRADAVLCVSSTLRERFARLRESREGVYLSPNAVDLDRFRETVTSSRGARGFDAGDTLIIFTGSFKPWHGVNDLLQAFALLLDHEKRTRLILVGDGPERESLMRSAAELRIESNITFTGAVSHEAIPALLASADIAVAPYLPLDDFYFSPLKLGEYLATGLPVVATACGDLDPLLRDDVSSLRVPPGDVPALARALGRLTEDPELRRRLGRAGRRGAEKHLSLEAATTRLVRLLESLVGAGSSDRRSAAP